MSLDRLLAEQRGNARNFPRRWLLRARRGQSLVEFALIALVLYLLLGAIITFGHLLYAAQGVQQAADLAAREISRAPLPADSLELSEVLRGDANGNELVITARQQIYDEHYLVLNLDTLHGYSSLQELVAALPVVNQQLYPLMIIDDVDGTRLLRYPGALFTDSNPNDNPTEPPPSGYLVAIPLVVSRPPVVLGTGFVGGGTETIDWVPVVEEIKPVGGDSPFRITSAQRGIVALRINYPYQSAAMSGYRPNPDDIFEPNVSTPIEADDGGVTVVDNDGYTPPGTLISSDNEYGPYAGEFGLGQQVALGMRVRPFRKLISAQAIYRRELFAEE